MKITDLKLNPDNPRLIKDDKFKKLVKSIKEFPIMLELRPIVVDKDMVILGGNMRYRALEELGYTELKDEWIKKADVLTDEEKKRFIIEDNVPFGEWDWEILNTWDLGELGEWGLDIPNDYSLNPDELGTEFDLPDGEKGNYQQITFTLTNEQAEAVREKLSEIKKTDGFKYCETFGNENSNANALYFIITRDINE